MTWRRLLALFGTPNVIVDFDCENDCLFLTINNIGTRPAHCISTSFDPTFTGMGGSREIPSLQLFEHTGFLPPGKAISTFVDSAAAYFTRDEPTMIQTSVSFEDAHGRCFENHASHNLGIYRDLPQLEHPHSPPT